jgi:hypothetical protein
MARELPPLDERHERAGFGKQEIARRARACFRERGQRGVMIVTLNELPFLGPDLDYQPRGADDEATEAGRVLSELLDTYDPERQAVLCYHDAAGDRAEAKIVDIESRH